MSFQIGDIKTKYEFFSSIIRDLEPFDRMCIGDMPDQVYADFSRVIVRVLEGWASLDINNSRFKFHPGLIISAHLHSAVVCLDEIIVERNICKRTIDRYTELVADPFLSFVRQSKSEAARDGARRLFGSEYDTIVSWGLV